MTAPARTVLITGASRGIGRAIASRLAEIGWDIGINYLQNRESAEEVSRVVNGLGRRAVLCQGDVGTGAGRSAALGAFRDAFGRIDALINNAGVAPKRREDLLDVDERHFDDVLATNLKGPLFMAVEVAKWMLELRRSEPDVPLHIVNVSSISEYAVTTTRAQYCVAKAGMGMTTQLLADRLAPHGIQVNEIRPGVIATDMTAGVREKYERRIAEGLTPIRRWGRPEDVAQAVAAILSGYFPFTTGAAFDVDGGFHIVRL